MDRRTSRLVSGSIEPNRRPGPAPRGDSRWPEIAAYGFVLGAATVVLTAVTLEALGGAAVVPAPAPPVIIASAPPLPPPVCRREAPPPPERMTLRAEVETDAEPARVGTSHTTPQGEYGVIRIGTDPGSRPAAVYVDGKHVGLTPIASYKVAPGRHAVRFEWADGPVVRKTVVVTADEATVVRAGNG